MKRINQLPTILRATLGVLILLPPLAIFPSPNAVPHAAHGLQHVTRSMQHTPHIATDDPSATPRLTTGLVITPTWSTTGNQAVALLGWAVAVGDVNGDGYADVIVGAPRYDHGQNDEGAAFLHLGGPEGPATEPAWTGESDQSEARFGQAVASAGDVNNDGYSDVIVGAPYYDAEESDEGAAFVYYGGPTGLVTTTVWVVHPTDQENARFGQAVATAGDVNGDGYSDVVITASGYDADETNEGAVFVYYGGPAGLSTIPAWSDEGGQGYANYGTSASTAGDVNRDGYSDLIVGAPWYDNPGTLDGTGFVYHGSAAGLSPTPDWMATGVATDSETGSAVATAGDVNDDGYSDVILGAFRQTGEHWHAGATFVYHGGSGGLATSPAWSEEGSSHDAKFGVSVATAGDVDGDGYADVIVGASNYADGEDYEGAAFVYAGGAGGLVITPTWSVEGDQQGAGYGFDVSSASDVNGDGYGDVIVGAPTYNDGQSDEGAAFVYLGSGEDDLLARPRQLQSDTYTPIAPLGRSNSANQVHLQVIAQPPQVVTSTTLQWQLAPLGVPFTATTAISGTSLTWTDVPSTSVVLSQTVDGLTGGTVYRWRVRLLYWPGDSQSRWLYLPWNGPNEADFRTADLLSPDRSTKVLTGQEAVYTHALTNLINETQTFTLTYTSSQGYTVTVAALSGGLTGTLGGFGSVPVTVTVQTPSTATLGTQDTTVVTATGSLSGYDAAYDVTTIGSITANHNHIFLPLVLRDFSPL
ncbi:MAG: integrin alpha [Anaerolineae bacterium]